MTSATLSTFGDTLKSHDPLPYHYDFYSGDVYMNFDDGDIFEQYRLKDMSYHFSDSDGHNDRLSSPSNLDEPEAACALFQVTGSQVSIEFFESRQQAEEAALGYSDANALVLFGLGAQSGSILIDDNNFATAIAGTSWIKVCQLLKDRNASLSLSTRIKEKSDYGFF